MSNSPNVLAVLVVIVGAVCVVVALGSPSDPIVASDGATSQIPAAPPDTSTPLNARTMTFQSCEPPAEIVHANAAGGEPATIQLQMPHWLDAFGWALSHTFVKSNPVLLSTTVVLPFVPTDAMTTSSAESVNPCVTEMAVLVPLFDAPDPTSAIAPIGCVFHSQI